MLIINADVRTMTGTRYKNGFIHTDGSKIIGVGSMEEIPKIKCDIFDANGQYAIPGFVDAHSHMGMWENGLGFEGDDGNEETDPCTPHIRGIDAVNPLDRSFQEALDYGVTSVVTGPGSANPIAGQMFAMKTYGVRVDNMIIKAPLSIKMAMGENPKTIYHEKAQGPSTRMGIAAIIREQLAKAVQYSKQKIRALEDEDYDDPEFDAKCDALLPLLRGEIKAHIHAHRTDDIFTAIRISKEFGFNYVIVHGTQGYVTAEELALEGANVITGPLIGARTKPELEASSIEGPGILKKAGVSVAICTDHPEVPIQYLLLSAQLAVQGGMDEEDALRAITCEAASICGLESRIGAIEVGRDADILLFEEEPMRTRRKPSSVFINGQKIR